MLRRAGLVYYKKRGSAKQQVWIPFSAVLDVERDSRVYKQPFSFQLRTSERLYALQASSEEDCVEWVEDIMQNMYKVGAALAILPSPCCPRHARRQHHTTAVDALRVLCACVVFFYPCQLYEHCALWLLLFHTNSTLRIANSVCHPCHLPLMPPATHATCHPCPLPLMPTATPAPS